MSFHSLILAVVWVSFLALPPAATASPDPLIVTLESGSFRLDVRIGSLADVEREVFITTAESTTFVLDTRIVGLADPAFFRVAQESGRFTLDTRLAGSSADPAAFRVVADTGAFTLDTRFGTVLNEHDFRVVAESAPFMLDTRFSEVVGASSSHFLATAESSAFALDTRFSATATDAAPFIVTAESAPFSLDTRLPGEDPRFRELVTEASSPSFTLDTRLPTADPRYASLLVEAESNPFTIDTSSRWLSAPTHTLARTDGFAAQTPPRFSPDGTLLLQSEGPRFLLWNLQSSAAPTIWNHDGGESMTLEFTPTGDQIVSAHPDGTVRFWDVATRQEVRRIQAPGTGPSRATLASDGARLLVGRGTDLGVYRTSDGSRIRSLPGLNGEATALALSPEGLVLAGSSTRTVQVWDTATGVFRHRLEGHYDLITTVGFLPGTQVAFSASRDGSVRMWDLETGSRTGRFNHPRPVTTATLSRDGRLLATTDETNPGNVQVLEMPSGSLLRVLTDRTPTASRMTGCALSPDQSVVASAHEDGQVRLWETGLEPQPTRPVVPLPPGTALSVSLRSHGLYYFSFDLDAGRNAIVILDGVAAGVGPSSGARRRMALGISPDAEFGNHGNPPSEGRRLLGVRTPPPNADITAVRMTATRGRLPSIYDYESFAQAAVSNLRCELPIAGSAGGKVYVLVFAPHLAAGSIAAQLRVEYSDFHVSGMVPATGGNAGNVTVAIDGTGITPDARARLISPTGGTVLGQLALWGDSTHTWFTFPLSNAPPGRYRLDLERPSVGIASLTNAFSVVAGTGPRLEAQIQAPSAARPGRDYNLILEYANMGDADMASPLFVLTANVENLHPSEVPLPRGAVPVVYAADGLAQVRRQPVSTSAEQKVGSLQLLGLNQSGPPSILPPGSRFSLPVRFTGDRSVGAMTFNLDVLRADETPVDWVALEPHFRPETLEPAVWSRLWANFQHTVGATWADYLRALNRESEILSRSGESALDMGDVLGALFVRASGTPFVRTLASSVDAAVPAPGLPMQFGRFATDGLQHRFEVGPLGRGWSHSYEFLLEPASSTAETILVRTPGTGARRFVRTGAGTWGGSGGDRGTLASVADGTFVLTEKEGLVWSFDATGRLAQIADPNQNTLRLTYGAGRLVRLQHSSGSAFELDYDGRGRLVELSDQAGQVTTYRYDSSGELLTEVVGPGGVVTRYSYRQAAGNAADFTLREIEHPDQTHQYFEHDAQGRLIGSWKDGEAEKVTLAYDERGRVQVRDASGNATTVETDSQGRILSVIDPLRRQIHLQYDPQQNLARVVGPAGDSTEFQHDLEGDVRTVTDASGHTLNFSYTHFSRLARLEDARRNPTEFVYDPWGNLTNIVYADHSAEGFQMNASGTLIQAVNRRGQAIQYRRNAFGQVEEKRYPSGRIITFRHDARGLLTNATDSVLGVHSLAYDPRGWLTNITYPGGRGFTFEYNAAGRRTRRIGHDGYTLHYGYDAVGRLASLHEGGGREIIRYQYDPRGYLQREEKGNGTWATYEYDVAGQITNLVNHAPDGSIQSRFQYRYDLSGNRTHQITLAGETRYHYDALNQLVGVEYPDGRLVSYDYDPAGNRIAVTDNGVRTPYTSNALNQYEKVGADTFEYDRDGNMTVESTATGTIRYHWDEENQLVRAEHNTSGNWEFVYDPFGNKAERKHNGEMTKLLHDPFGFLDVVAEYNSSGKIENIFNHGLGLVEAKRDSTYNQFFSYDASGNTSELTGENGRIIAVCAYDAFGVLLTVGTEAEKGFTFGGRFGVSTWTSQIYATRRRFYDGRIGRFISQDPSGLLGGSHNLYRFANSSPINFVDPKGESAVRDREVMDLVKHALTQNNGSIGGAFDDLRKLRDQDPHNLEIRDAENFVFSMEAARKDLWFRIFGLPLTAAWPLFKNLLIARNITTVAPPILPSHFLFLSDKSASIPPELDFWVPGTFDQFKFGAAGYFAGMALASTRTVQPLDPNDKLSPAGIGPNRVVPLADEIEYTIRFENFATATAPVQELVVVDYLDAALDWTTVRFKEIAYGGRILTPTTVAEAFALRDAPPADSPAVAGTGAATMVIDATGNRNPQTGRLEWRISALDTNTLTFPEDALTGFLPPENGTGRGNGYLRFGVRPKADLPIGTVITNTATIVFDGNDPISTPPVSNTLADIPSLVASISYLPSNRKVGIPFSYNIDLTNTGPSTITNVVVTNTVPAGVSVTSATPNRGTVTVDGQTVRWDLGTLLSGETSTLQLVVTPSRAGTFDNSIAYAGGSRLAIFAAPSEFQILDSTPEPVPAIGIRIDGQVLELAWPSTASGFVLESTSALGSQASWAPVVAATQMIGGQTVVRTTLSESVRFYRLRHQ